MDASGLTAGLVHKICLDLDGLASATHGVIDLEEAIYISPILQLNTTSVKNAPQQELSFQCKAQKEVICTAFIRYHRSARFISNIYMI